MMAQRGGWLVAGSVAAGMDRAERLELAGEGLACAAGVEDDAPRSGRNGALAAALELGGAAAAPLASLALNSTAGCGAMLRRAMLRRVPRGERSMAGLGRIIDAAAPVFDGRLLIAAVALGSGRPVIFGSPRAPRSPLAP